MPESTPPTEDTHAKNSIEAAGETVLQTFKAVTHKISDSNPESEVESKGSAPSIAPVTSEKPFDLASAAASALGAVIPEANKDEELLRLKEMSSESGKAASSVHSLVSGARKEEAEAGDGALSDERLGAAEKRAQEKVGALMSKGLVTPQGNPGALETASHGSSASGQEGQQSAVEAIKDAGTRLKDTLIGSGKAAVDNADKGANEEAGLPDSGRSSG